MSKRPNLDNIKLMFEEGENFSLNRSKYINLTGVDIPQNKSYTEKRSAVARCADEYGYYVVVVPEVLEFRKK